MEKIKTGEILTGDLDDFINETYVDLMKDKEFVKYIEENEFDEQQVKENIGMFIVFHDDLTYCRNCPGLNACKKSQAKHYQVLIKKNGKFVERQYSPCPLLSNRMKQESHYIASDFPEEWKQVFFADVSITQSRAKILRQAISIVKSKTKKGLYVSGGKRVGKTYLMVTILNELIETKKYRVALINANRRFAELQDCLINNRDKFKRLFRQYIDVDVLVIDDFGNEYKSDYVRDNIVFPLIDGRAKREKITLFTSDFTIDEITELYSYNRGSSIRARQLTILLKTICEEIILKDDNK